jgi:hypothetical protein
MQIDFITASSYKRVSKLCKESMGLLLQSHILFTTTGKSRILPQNFYLHELYCLVSVLKLKSMIKNNHSSIKTEPMPKELAVGKGIQFGMMNLPFHTMNI